MVWFCVEKYETLKREWCKLGKLYFGRMGIYQGGQSKLIDSRLSKLETSPQP